MEREMNARTTRRPCMSDEDVGNPEAFVIAALTPKPPVEQFVYAELEEDIIEEEIDEITISTCLVDFTIN
jgi:hypothetical protein